MWCPICDVVELERKPKIYSENEAISIEWIEQYLNSLKKTQHEIDNPWLMNDEIQAIENLLKYWNQKVRGVNYGRL